MPTDLHGPRRLLIAALVAVAVLATPAGASAREASSAQRGLAQRATRALSIVGLIQVHTSCSRHGRCRWRGEFHGRACSGMITAAKHGSRRMRVFGVRCASDPKPPLLFGFNTYTDQLTVGKQRVVGANITRLWVNWYDVEPQPGVWNWTSIDQQYQQILAGGLRPLIVVNGAPCWALANCQLLFGSPPTPSHDSDWSAYVRTVTARYPRAVGVEVWNEPNLSAAFYPQANPQRYTQLLAEAYTAVKSANQNMPVISGGIAMNDGWGCGQPGCAGKTFLADMYADGAARYMDAVAIHVYPTDTASDGSKVWDTAALTRWLAQVKDAGAAAGIPSMPIWITEMGVSTSTEAGFPPAVTPGQQASDLLSMLRTSQTDPDVRAAIIDSLQDAAPDILGQLVDGVTGSTLNFDVSYGPVEEGLGVFTDNWVPKPAACAISPAMGGWLTC